MDKKNTILLTVIAIATLLVAVVGATFAYFTAQTGSAAQADIDVKTETTDTATMSTFEKLSINATLQNFGADDASLMASTEGYVSFTASDVTGREESAEYCYKTEIDISENEFIYSLPKTKGDSSTHYPELVLNIWKAAGQNSNDLTNIDSGDTNRYAQTMKFDTENHQLFYDDNILSSGYVCTDNLDYSQETETRDTKCKTLDDSTNKLKGYDITVIGNDAYTGGDVPSYTAKKISIPKKDSISGEMMQDQDFIHKITATSGADPKPVYDLWKVSVTLVNYKDNTPDGLTSGDQSKYEFGDNGDATNVGNAGRKFNAQLKFIPVDCTSGKSLAEE